MDDEYGLYQQGEIWYVRFRRGGKRVSVSTGKINEKAAHRVALEIVRKAPGSDINLGEFLRPFYSDKCPHVTRLRLEGRPYAEKNRQAQRSLLERLILPDPICELSLGRVTRADVLGLRSRLVETLGGPCRTVNVAMRLFAVAIHEAIYLEFIDKDPCARIGSVVYPKTDRKALSVDQLRAVLVYSSWGSITHWAATCCAAMTGMRAGEVRALQWADLDPKGKTISVSKALDQTSGLVQLPKWGKTRMTAYPRELQAVLEPSRGLPLAWVFQEGKGAMGYSRWAKEFSQVAKAVGIPGATLHGLRHTLNTMLRGRGVSDDLLQGSFGWSGPEVQAGYTHRELYDLKGQADAVDLILAPKPKRRQAKTRPS